MTKAWRQGEANIIIAVAGFGGSQQLHNTNGGDFRHRDKAAEESNTVVFAATANTIKIVRDVSSAALEVGRKERERERSRN